MRSSHNSQNHCSWGQRSLGPGARQGGQDPAIEEPRASQQSSSLCEVATIWNLIAGITGTPVLAQGWADEMEEIKLNWWKKKKIKLVESN